ncbi:type IV secretion system DNA-binding domain-containing protein [Sphingomonas sp. BAUL-RG-20F-R05-02]|uniref:type IV secretion system DNA-binding domain-containing protein n=1 Tax=Sphingomonas sp. BAUL-RG-20F-R05-02 TaxID=2914830 RepID=UPI001F56D226|nr:type IV secretion system DNA-binding domain-containing protein [Sphingomonas sp. BAUL-RG-20F-R05-02]
MTAIEISRGRAIEARRSQAILTLVRVAAVGALLGLVIGAALAWFASSPDDRQLATVWTRAQIVRHFDPATLLRPAPTPEATGFGEPVTPEHVAAMKLLTRIASAGVVAAILLGAGMTTLLRHQWIATARKANMDQVLRGSRTATAQQVASLVALAKKKGRSIVIGGVPIPPGDENRHLLLSGKTGSGKTTALRAIVRQIAERGEAALIFDPDGSYISAFYQPERGDVILNPWDARTARWNPLADVTDLADAKRLATILIPKPKGLTENAIWYDQARTVVAQLVHHLVRTGRADLDVLATMLASADKDELSAIVAGTPAARVFEAGADKATSSVLFMLSAAADIVALLAAIPTSAAPFSFDGFYSRLDDQDGPAPFIFLAAPRRYRASADPAIVAWIDAAASAILQRPPDCRVNAWMILDELPSLPRVESLLTLLPEGRKHRAAITIAFQSIAQVVESYGEQGSQILTGQAGTQIIMAAGDHATAKWASDLAGTTETEGQRPSETLDIDAKTERGSLTTTRDRCALIFDSEVMGLAIGEAFVRLSGYPVACVTIAPPLDEPAIAPAFIPAPVVNTPATPAAMPTPATRIEDRDDWLTMEGPE